MASPTLKASSRKDTGRAEGRRVWGRSEMRKQQLGVVLPLLIVFLVAAAAQTQNTGTVATTHAALQRLNVVRGEGAISVEFTARGPVTPKLSTLSSPARVVIDLPNTVALTDQHQIAVDSEGVKGVRVGMNGGTPPSTRVVVDLEQACQFELVPGDDNKFAVKLHPGVPMAKAGKSAVTAKATPKAAAPSGAKLLTVAAVTPALPAVKPVVAEKKEMAVKQPARDRGWLVNPRSSIVPHATAAGVVARASEAG